MNDLQTKSERVDNTLVWILAFIPILAIVVSLIDIPITRMNSISSKLLIRVPAFLNVGLGIFDERKLKKIGYETKGLLPWVIWFIPVYLIKRRKLLKQKRSYDVVCIATYTMIAITLFILIIF
ncbi:hypothetical protein Curi_c14600 [Gottschalkia acidurici 9a]|uniref:Uncharacterized protein n=1 Tax=Gottschalkia acidurici (strain ATCC 7906 / DSM 604 / BCRC 14475 / CIP 104303 / KCTC 5404 / NCIMB 10678 / 9a) TaxID=1128398 RepID=K0B0N6_GOTA9|nr:hypothetical protein [Gottschalkia acidurici]AFS78470.1 hypothetical protein Curi_c14600 [Gottschalkia acidurici 9a]